MFRLVSAGFKIVVASLLTGAVLSALNISTNEVLAGMGLTPETIIGLLEHGTQWAIPNIVLGSLVIIPMWIVVSLLRPPRS